MANPRGTNKAETVRVPDEPPKNDQVQDGLREGVIQSQDDRIVRPDVGTAPAQPIAENSTSMGNSTRLREAGYEPQQGVPPRLVGSSYNDPYGHPTNIDFDAGEYVVTDHGSHAIRLANTSSEGKVATPADHRYLNPTSFRKVAEAASTSAVDDDFTRRVDERVAELLRDIIADKDVNTKKLESRVGSSPTTFDRTTPIFYEENHKGHYRNDTTPNVTIVEREMVEDGKGGWYPGGSIRGGSIVFRRGHFFATTDNQVRQLNWMMENPSVDSRTGMVVGGDPGIYMDDGNSVVMCPAGCGAPFVANSAALKSHMRAAHGVQ